MSRCSPTDGFVRNWTTGATDRRQFAHNPFGIRCFILPGQIRFGQRNASSSATAPGIAALGDAMYSFFEDVRFAARQLRKSPGFTITAVLSLAVGIGINTSMFSSMDAVVLRPLAVPQFDRVMTIAEQRKSGDIHSAALANFEDWQRQNRSFESLAVRSNASMTLTGAGDAAAVDTALVSPNFFTVLRAQPYFGRVFTQADSQPGHDGVAVLSYGFWKRNFASDPNVAGRSIELDQHKYSIIGVMPRTMQYPSEADLYLPFAPTPEQLANRSSHGFLVEGRLRDGVTVEQAQSGMRIIASQLEKQYPATNENWTVRVEPLLDGINGDLTPLYYRLIMGATLFVLLVVCANVANLQLARGVARRPEIAMRTALGASRWRVLRQLLTENLLIALIGAAGGLAVGWLHLHFTVITMPARIAKYIPGWANTTLNGRALAFSMLLAIVAGFVATVAPALEALRVDPVEQLKAGGRSSVGSGRARLRTVFSVAQIALAVALVIGATLISKGMDSLLHKADVYSPQHTLIFTVDLPDARYNTPEKLTAFYRDSLDRLRALPGVTHADTAAALPYSDDGWERDLAIENRPVMPGKYQSAIQLAVSDSYFGALKIPIVSGRGLSRGDTLRTVPVAVVSERFVSQYFPGQNPIGKRVRLGGRDSKDPWLTIVGVARDTRYELWDPTPHAVVYMSATQVPMNYVRFVIYTDGDPLALASPVHKAIASIDPLLPLKDVESWAQYQREALVGLIYAAADLAVDALIALLLAAIGIFAVMANLVGERTREIGVRLAMGASRENVLGMILRRASWLTGIGLGAGLVLAFTLARLVANLLIGVSSSDPVIFSGVTLAIAVVAMAASWLPARRAARLEPMAALRDE
jgi:putative ABC transport system permease protein